MSVQPDFRSPLTEIDLILSRVISSLVNPRDVSPETIATALEQLTRARALLLDLAVIPEDGRPSRTLWRMGIESDRAGARVAFFRETDGTVDLFPLSWSLEDGESDRLPAGLVDRYLVDWLATLPPDGDSWLYEALRELSGIWIAHDRESSLETLENSLIAAKISSPDRIHRVERTIATALAHVALAGRAGAETLLIVQGGGEMTELALIEIPADPLSLSRRSIAFSRFEYGSETFTRHLLEHAIYPRWRAIVADSLPDLDSLDDHPLGRALREAARLTLLILQERSEFTSRLGDRAWTVHRAEVEREVIQPFIGLLRQKVGFLLESSRKNLTENDRVIFCGDFFLSLWPLLSSALTVEFLPAPIVAPDSETISPALFGLGRVPLYPSLEDRSGNND
ncbi:hypothetical protein V0288_00130 [Pannus brasiliensis CCIBt3594]|uniref:Uncharacterized protein n=1 Tax=Pannus brasiliensis CCIBt3594 TaxID=1427578 RepID=A0AAW9QPZ7_9CHRO